MYPATSLERSDDDLSPERAELLTIQGAAPSPKGARFWNKTQIRFDAL